MNLRFQLVAGWLICLASCCAMNVAFAKTVKAGDARLIRLVVQSQLEALAEDDAAKAFALATPEVRNELGSPQNLLQMVKDQYDPMRRYRMAIFLAAETADEDSATQTVRITDPDNKVWLVVYEMQHETDGSWKIDGWQLMETDTISV